MNFHSIATWQLLCPLLSRVTRSNSVSKVSQWKKNLTTLYHLSFLSLSNVMSQINVYLTVTADLTTLYLKWTYETVPENSVHDKSWGSFILLVLHTIFQTSKFLFRSIKPVFNKITLETRGLWTSVIDYPLLCQKRGFSGWTCLKVIFKSKLYSMSHCFLFFPITFSPPEFEI